MTKDVQSENPYAPPVSPADPPVAELAETDEIQDMLERAFFAATYGTFFLPGVAYLISIFLLIKACTRRKEFSPTHQRLFETTSMICGILLVLIGGATALMTGEGLFQWSRYLQGG